VQSDNKIIVAFGDASSGSNVIRLGPLGALDTTFGTSGYADAFPYVSFSALAWASDGSILAGGAIRQNISDLDFALAKIDTSGKAALAFGTNGVATASFHPHYESILRLVVQSDGRVIGAGFTNDPVDAGTHYPLALARFDGTTGALDSTFGSGG